MKKPITATELAEILHMFGETIDRTYGNTTSRLLPFKPLGISSVYAAIKVADQDADLFSRVIKTILLKGGLYSQNQPPHSTVDPIVFQFRKDVMGTSRGVSHHNFLIAQVAPYGLRKAARAQVSLLRAILADPRNVLPGISPELSLREEKPELVAIGI